MLHLQVLLIIDVFLRSELHFRVLLKGNVKSRRNDEEILTTIITIKTKQRK